MKNVIMQLTGIPDEVYNKIVFESGMAFAEFYFSFDPKMVGTITSTKAYWVWYKNQFTLLCKQFCGLHGNSEAPRNLMRKLFESMLTPENQIAYPGQYVIEAAINQVLSECISERKGAAGPVTVKGGRSC